METKKIIATCPEYENKNPIIRKLFWNRVKFALKLSGLKTQKEKNLNILDIGCGRAKLFEIINGKKHSFKLYGIDVNEDVAKLKMNNAQFKVIKGESEKYPFKSNMFDVIFALDCFEHIENLDKEIEKMAKVIKKNGKFVISGPTETFLYRLSRLIFKGTWLEVYEGEIHHHTIYGIKKKLLNHGFKLMEEKTLPYAILPFFKVYQFVYTR